ncbi:MAG: RluA family pseudouridine synthase [Deltaproteobacteria bacterium]
MNIPVIYDDNWLMVVDKPSGLLSVPAPGKGRRTLVSILNEEARPPETPPLLPCHRLDRETSGLIVFAKGKETEELMADLFRARRVKKTYIAFAQGRVAGHGRIARPVDGVPAATRYHAVGDRRDFTVLKVFPETGRTNQIRIHFKAIGHPLVGETKFAFRKDYALKAKRVMLHAESLEFEHPVTKRPLRLTAPLPADMQRFLEEHD